MQHFLAITPLQGLAFGLLTLPICLWVVWTDLSEMKIRNKAVLALLAVFVLAGPALLPLEEYLWRYSHFAVVLAIGFVMSLMGVGAGDAKFAAAMAPFVALPDAGLVIGLYVAFSVLLLVGMWLARLSGTLRAAAPGWIWFHEDQRRHVPLGVGLAPTLMAYFALAAAYGAAPGGLLP